MLESTRAVAVALEYLLEMADYEASWRLNEDSYFPHSKIVEAATRVRAHLADLTVEAPQAQGGQVWQPVNMKVRDRVIGEWASCDFDVKDGLIEVIDSNNYKLRHIVRLLGNERLCKLTPLPVAQGAAVPDVDFRAAIRLAAKTLRYFSYAEMHDVAADILEAWLGDAPAPRVEEVDGEG